MEKKYHVNNKGEIGLCRARKSPCRFGEEMHSGSKEGAQRIAEKEIEKEFMKEYKEFHTTGDKIDPEEITINWKDYRSPMGNRVTLDGDKIYDSISKTDYFKNYREAERSFDESMEYMEYQMASYYNPGNTSDGKFIDRPSVNPSKNKKEFVYDVFSHQHQEDIDDGLIDSLDRVGFFEESNYRASIGRSWNEGEYLEEIEANSEMSKKAKDVYVTWKLFKSQE